MLRVACHEEAVVAFEVFAQGREAVLYRLMGIVFVVDAFWARGRSEVFVCGLLAVISWWVVVMLMSGVD